jgi:hypothetical protein
MTSDLIWRHGIWHWHVHWLSALLALLLAYTLQPLVLIHTHWAACVRGKSESVKRVRGGVGRGPAGSYVLILEQCETQLSEM